MDSCLTSEQRGNKNFSNGHFQSFLIQINFNIYDQVIKKLKYGMNKPKKAFCLHY